MGAAGPGTTARPATAARAARRIDCVVFDLDGVLVDSEPERERVTAAYLAELGVDMTDATWQASLGQRVRDFSVEVAKQVGLPADDVFAELVARYAALNADGRGLEPMRFLDESLDRLHGSGRTLAVASSGTRPYVEHALAVLGVRDRFAAVVTGDDVERGKPDPAIYLAAARLLEAAPSACVAVEDAPNGVASASAAGMQVIAMPNGASRHLDFTAADATVSDLRAAVDAICGESPRAS